MQSTIQESKKSEKIQTLSPETQSRLKITLGKLWAFMACAIQYKLEGDLVGAIFDPSFIATLNRVVRKFNLDDAILNKIVSNIPLQTLSCPEENASSSPTFISSPRVNRQEWAQGIERVLNSLTKTPAYTAWTADKALSIYQTIEDFANQQADNAFTVVILNSGLIPFMAGLAPKYVQGQFHLVDSQSIHSIADPSQKHSNVTVLSTDKGWDKVIGDLQEKSVNSEQPTLIIADGVMTYLSSDMQVKLLEALHGILSKHNNSSFYCGFLVKPQPVNQPELHALLPDTTFDAEESAQSFVNLMNEQRFVIESKASLSSLAEKCEIALGDLPSPHEVIFVAKASKNVPENQKIGDIKQSPILLPMNVKVASDLTV